MYCDWPYLGRCCFCMPLRQGVITYGYIHIFLNAFMIGMYSYTINYADSPGSMLHLRAVALPTELCLTFSCFELIFDALLIYAAHKKILSYLKAFYYYSVTTCGAVLLLQIIDIIMSLNHRLLIPSAIEKAIFGFVGICLQVYLVTLVRSLIRKEEESESHVFGNQLQQIVVGELMSDNKIYNDTTMLPHA